MPTSHSTVSAVSSGSDLIISGAVAGAIAGDQSGGKRGASAVAEASADLDNMAGANRHAPTFGGGVDTLEVTIHGVLTEKFRETTIAVEEQVKEARASRFGYGLLEVWGATYRVKPRGFRWGNSYLAHVLEYDGITIALTADPDQSSKFAVGMVRIGSIRLMRDGHWAAWQAVLAQLKELGIECVRSSVARIDVCVDLPGVSVDPFCRAVANEQVISRARQTDFYKSGRKWTGFSMGKETRVRVYDKRAELEARPDEIKEELLREMRWGGTIPRDATRVEFQIRGSGLRGKWKGLKSVESVFEALPQLVLYLSEEFFRLVESVDRENGHQSRAKTLDLWEEVVTAFLGWVEKEWVPVAKAEKRVPECRRLKSQALGCLMSIAAMMPKRYSKREDLIRELAGILESSFPEDWSARLDARRRDLEARGASAFLGIPPDDCEPGCRCSDCAK